MKIDDVAYWELHRTNAQMFALMMRTYLSFGDELRESINDMARIASDPLAEDDEQEMAVDTICEALFPTEELRPLTHTP